METGRPVLLGLRGDPLPPARGEAGVFPSLRAATPTLFLTEYFKGRKKSQDPTHFAFLARGRELSKRVSPI